MYEFLLPDAGEGTHESEIVAWHVKEGDKVEEFDNMFAMESDKATVDVSAPVAGTIAKILVPAGEVGIVGKPVCLIDTGDGHSEITESSAKGDSEDAAQTSAQTGSQHSDATTADSKSEKGEPTGDAAATGAAKAAPAAQPKPAEAAPSAKAAPTSTPVNDGDIRTLAVPRVRIYARKKDVDLRFVKGTGNHGKITIEDVDNYLENPTTGASEQSNPAGQIEWQTPATRPASAGLPKREHRREPLSSMRKATNRAIMRSYSQAPHVTIMDRVDCTNLKALHKSMKGFAAELGAKVTFTHYIVKAAAAMLQLHPDLNAKIDEEASEMEFFDAINIGVAVDTPNGLVVPVIRDADRLPVLPIAREMSDLADKAMSGKLGRADMSGGSLTITNVGGFATGGVWSTPIINNGESVIIGIGRIEDEFMPDENGQPVLKPMMKISFAFDHRVVDGVAAQKALNDFKRFIADPILMLAEG